MEIPAIPPAAPQRDGGLVLLPEQGSEGKCGAPGLRQAGSHLSESPGTQQLPLENALVPEGVERAKLRY